MKSYRKPSCISEGSVRGIVPLAAVVGAVASMSLAEAAAAGALAGLGLNAISTIGGKELISLETKSLNKPELVAI